VTYFLIFIIFHIIRWLRYPCERMATPLGIRAKLCSFNFEDNMFDVLCTYFMLDCLNYLLWVNYLWFMCSIYILCFLCHIPYIIHLCCCSFFTTHTHTHTHTHIYIYIVVEDQDDKWKSWRTKMYKMGKIDNPIMTDKSPNWWKYFYLG
jgi:hypothetical protein